MLAGEPEQLFDTPYERDSQTGTMPNYDVSLDGQGIVVRARDTTRDRDVALKVLPEALVPGP